MKNRFLLWDGEVGPTQAGNLPNITNRVPATHIAISMWCTYVFGVPKAIRDGPQRVASRKWFSLDAKEQEPKLRRAEPRSSSKLVWSYLAVRTCDPQNLRSRALRRF
jgi:hypothetical protein